MRVLGIETSCDETSVAVVEEGRILANVVSSQARLHERFGGVVPEIASRAHLEMILPALDAAFAQAGGGVTDCDGIAVTHRPGLIGALLVGVTAAKTLAFLHEKPIVPVDHLLAHLHAVRMTAPDAPYPQVVLLVSGGHTALYRLDSPLSAECLGATADDAAGEAFDKVAKMLGLGYPGGPALERLAAGGNPRAVAFPRPRPPARAAFSFSGLKTAVLYHLQRSAAGDPPPAIGAKEKADVAASFQRLAVEILVDKTEAAAGALGVEVVGIAGGVAANGPLRQAMERMCVSRRWRMVSPPMALCTDNAAMVAALGESLLAAGVSASLDFDAYDSVA